LLKAVQLSSYLELVQLLLETVQLSSYLKLVQLLLEAVQLSSYLELVQLLLEVVQLSSYLKLLQLLLEAVQLSQHGGLLLGLLLASEEPVHLCQTDGNMIGLAINHLLARAELLVQDLVGNLRGRIMSNNNNNNNEYNEGKTPTLMAPTKLLWIGIVLMPIRI